MVTKGKVLICPFLTYEVSFFKVEMVKIKPVVREASSVMNQNTNTWKGKCVFQKIYISAFMGLSISWLTYRLFKSF